MSTAILVTKPIEIVISRFKENICWLAEEQYAKDFKTIYNKGLPDIEKRNEFSLCNEISLPNVGREGHSFLYHIVHNYDNLADVTIFLPGSCMDEIKVSKTLEVINKAKESNNTVISGKWYDDIRSNLYNFSIDSWVGLSSENKSAQPSSSCAPALYRPFGRWFDHYIGLDVRVHVACFTSTLAVSKKHILQQPRIKYEQLLVAMSKHSNPEDGHFLERSWNALFYPVPVCVILMWCCC